MENCVPVVVTTVDGNTVAAVFWDTDWREVDLDEDDGDGNTGDDFDVDVTVKPDLDEDSLITREDGTWVTTGLRY